MLFLYHAFLLTFYLSIQSESSVDLIKYGKTYDKGKKKQNMNEFTRLCWKCSQNDGIRGFYYGEVNVAKL